MRITGLIFILIVLGWIQSNAADDPWTLYPREYKDWEKAILNDSRSSLFKKAFLGDPDALHRQFLRALKRMKEPYVLAGEDIGALEFEYQLLLYRLGDRRFSQMLASEQLIVRAAVREFIPFARMPGKFPLTEKLLEGTRKIDFPALKITREDAKKK